MFVYFSISFFIGLWKINFSSSIFLSLSVFYLFPNDEILENLSLRHLFPNGEILENLNLSSLSN